MCRTRRSEGRRTRCAQQRGQRGQISPGSGQDVIAWQWVPVGTGGWPLGPTGAIDVNSSRLPCNQLARLDPALAWLLCGKRVYFCLPSWAGVCRWCGGCGVVRWGEETRGRGRAARGREPGSGVWCAARMPSLRAEKLQPRPGQIRERRGESLGKNRSVAPPDPRDASRRRGTGEECEKKGARGGRWYSDSQVSLCSNTEREEAMECQTTQFKKRRR